MNSSAPDRDVPSGSRREAAACVTDSPVATDEEELVDEMIDESFPGSDPPSTWAGADEPPPISS